MAAARRCAAPAPASPTRKRCVPASPPSPMWPAARSPPSKASTPPAIIRCRKRGASSTCRNAVSARSARSCRRLLCSARIQNPRMTRSAKRCQATSAAAAAISVSKTPFISLQRGCDMNILTNPKRLRGFEQSIGPIRVENVSRPIMLKALGIAGGFVLAAPIMSRPAFAAYQTGADKMPHGVVVDPRVFVAIAPDGAVTIIAHRSEMGTGVRTRPPLIVAEEMEADWNRVKVQQAHGDEVKFGNQDTDGSRSTRHYLIPMRQIGAAARTMLEAAAAKHWGVPVTEVKASNHEVVHAASGRPLGFGDLAADASKEAVPAIGSLKLKDPKDFRYLGKGDICIVDLHDITTGAANYGADIRLPGMKN